MKKSLKKTTIVTIVAFLLTMAIISGCHPREDLNTNSPLVTNEPTAEPLASRLVGRWSSAVSDLEMFEDMIQESLADGSFEFDVDDLKIFLEAYLRDLVSKTNLILEFKEEGILTTEFDLPTLNKEEFVTNGSNALYSDFVKHIEDNGSTLEEFEPAFVAENGVSVEDFVRSIMESAWDELNGSISVDLGSLTGIYVYVLNGNQLRVIDGSDTLEEVEVSVRGNLLEFTGTHEGSFFELKFSRE